jgi:hypothetical protein
MEALDIRNGSIVELWKPFISGTRISEGWRKVISIEPGKINGQPSELFEPIVITSQSLYIIGFNMNSDKITNYEIDLEQDADGTYIVHYNNKVVYRKARFIHELQNIYLMLTYKELEIN